MTKSNKNLSRGQPSYLQGTKLSVTWNGTYTAVSGIALANGITLTTASVFTSFPSFTSLITNLWNEYRVEKLVMDCRFTKTPEFSGLFIPVVYAAQFRGNAPPAASIAGITALPWNKQAMTTNRFRIVWNMPRDDPEAMFYFQSTVAADVSGGIVFYVAAAAPTASVTYMVIRFTAGISVRGRKI